MSKFKYRTQRSDYVCQIRRRRLARLAGPTGVAEKQDGQGSLAATKGQGEGQPKAPMPTGSASALADGQTASQAATSAPSLPRQFYVHCSSVYWLSKLVD